MSVNKAIEIGVSVLFIAQINELLICVLYDD